MAQDSAEKTKVIPENRRLLYFGHAEGNNAFKYRSNFIKTSKYNLLTFLPKSILVQFKRYANVYFLFTAIFQSIPQISPLHPFSAIAPFLFVIALAVLREGYEDYLRHVSDTELNSNTCTVYRNGRFVEDQWRKLQVGDVVKVEDSESFPADLIVLVSSNLNAMCYIETASLDGEKNLKPKVAPKETTAYFDPQNPAVRFVGTIQCDAPNPALYQYEGVLALFGETKVSLGPKQLLLRGAKLKNTEWIIGVVCYTGEDTKVMKNAESSKFKQSNVEKVVNYCILSILIIELLLCLLCAVANFVWDHVYLDGKQEHEVYLVKEYQNGTQAVLNYFSYFLLFNTMIPISLVISLEFVKLIQSYFIKKDEEMFNKESGRYANVSTSSIIEELGQVEYVFSDKTGTLTCNRMEFKECVIGHHNYGGAGADGPGFESSPLVKEATFVDKRSEIAYTFDDKALGQQIVGSSSATETIDFRITGTKDYRVKSQQDLIAEFLKCLSLCHDCLLEKTKDGSYAYQVKPYFRFIKVLC